MQVLTLVLAVAACSATHLQKNTHRRALRAQNIDSPSFAVTEEILQEARNTIQQEAEAETIKLQQVWNNSNVINPRKLASLFSHTFRYSAENSLKIFADDNTVFVTTGDIGQMWLRDSSVQLSAYLQLASKSKKGSAIRQVLESAMARQRRFILDDPYGSAFYDRHGPGTEAGPNKESCPPTPSCPECHCEHCAPACGKYTYQKDWELDSLLFPILLHYTYWKNTGSTSHLNAELKKVMETSLQTMRTEQSHSSKSKYRYLPFTGDFAQNIGLVWSFALPSDDQAGAYYNVPENIMAAVVLRKAAEMASGPLKEPKLAKELEALSAEIAAAVKKYGIVKDTAGQEVYAFAVNGLGDHIEMDDANLPNLLWLPYFNIDEKDDADPVYKATRQLVLSSRDSNFFGDGSIRGLGSAHHSFGLTNSGNRCDGQCIWHLGLAMQGLTAKSHDEKLKVMQEILATDAGTELLHEGFEANNPSAYNRDGFGFANSVFAQWVLRDWLVGTI